MTIAIFSKVYQVPVLRRVRAQQYESDHVAPVPYRPLHCLSFVHQVYHRQPAMADAVIVNFRRQCFPLKVLKDCNSLYTALHSSEHEYTTGAIRTQRFVRTAAVNERA